MRWRPTERSRVQEEPSVSSNPREEEKVQSCLFNLELKTNIWATGYWLLELLSSLKDKDLSGCKVYGSVAMWVSVSDNCPKDKEGRKTGLALVEENG